MRMQRDTIVRQGLDCHLNWREVGLHCSTSIQSHVAIPSSEGLGHLNFAYETHLSCTRNRNDVTEIDVIITETFAQQIDSF